MQEDMGMYEQGGWGQAHWSSQRDADGLLHVGQYQLYILLEAVVKMRSPWRL